MALWSAALGLAGSIYGANQASKSAAASLAQQQYEFERNRELQQANMALALQAQQQQREENAYQRRIEGLNRNLIAEERRYQLNESQAYKDQLMDERRYMIERQIAVDKEAAAQRQFQIEQLLQNQNLAQDERDFAIQQLNEVKATASGERDQEMRMLLEDRARAEIERDFIVGQYQDAQSQYMNERQQDLAVRDAVLAQIGGLQDALSAKQQDLGPAPVMAQLTEADIAAEIERRQSAYQSDVDRAADKVASVNEADLIRGGMDVSTTGTARRGDIASRLAQEYQNARDRAYDDALKYISGKTQTLDSNVSDIMKLREALLAEQAGVSGAGIDQMSRLPGVASATGAYGLMSAIPSSIYSRNVTSANNFSAPVSIGTGIYDNISIGSGLGNTLNSPSAASNIGFSVQSGVFNPYGVTVNNPQSYLSNANSIATSMLTAAQNSYANAQTNAVKAGSGVGDALNTFGKELDSWWSSRKTQQTTTD